jgi:hypothetical protein
VAGTGAPPQGGRSTPAPKKGDAFDLWLRHGLRRLYNIVAAEPIPADLLRLIDDGRATRVPDPPHGRLPERSRGATPTG